MHSGNPFLPEMSVGSNTELAECYLAGSTEYYVSLCNKGSTKSRGYNAVARRCSQPSRGHHVTVPCKTGHVSSSLGVDTSIIPCSRPMDGQYVSSACIPGNESTLGVDTKFSTCSTVVPPNMFV